MSKKKNRKSDKGQEKSSPILVKMDPPFRRPFTPPESLERVLQSFEAEAILTDLRKIHALASQLECDYHPNASFPFFKAEYLKELSGRSTEMSTESFWRELDLLMVFTVKTAARVLYNLVDGLASALADRNLLSTALMLRALIEHTAAFHYIRCSLEDSQLFLVENRNRSLLPNASDHKLHETLILHICGRRTSLSEEDCYRQFQSKKAYENFCSEYEITGGTCAINVKTFNKGLAILDNPVNLGILYDLLCEYCHPNSNSRNSEFDSLLKSDVDTELKAKLVLSDDQFSPGIVKVMRLVHLAVPSISHTVSNALTRLNEAILSAQPVEYIGKNGSIPRGYMPLNDIQGRTLFIRDCDVSFDLTKARKYPLTEEQVARVRSLYLVFEDAHADTFEKWLDGFMADGSYADSEIRLWQKMAKVYQQECFERGIVSYDERNCLFEIIRLMTIFPTLKSLLVNAPRLKNYPELDRVFFRLMKALEGE